MTATLRLLHKADKEIQKLPRIVKGAIYEFQHKFRDNPDNPGLQFKQLKGDSRLYSARVTQDYRALLLHAGGSDYILVAVRHRKDVYDNLDRYAYQVNPVTGGIEFLDLVSVHDAARPSPAAAPPEKPLFAAYSTEQLLALGVAEPLLPLIGKITTEEELLGLAEYAPELTQEVLLGLYSGKTFEQVLDEITTPVTAEEPVSAEDYATALTRPTTRVTSADTELQDVIEGDFNQWKVFLHPTQRKLVEREYVESAKVSGGPGTGKTIVALHRVKYLAGRPGLGQGKPILLTTFTKNLAADLKKRLLELGGRELLDRVDVMTIDGLATQIVSQAEPGGKRRWIGEDKALQEWRDLLLEIGDTRYDAEFLHAEWTEVILEQQIASRTDYFRASRAGRGRTLGRIQRAEIWQLVEKYTMRLDEKNLWTFRQVAERAGGLEEGRARQYAQYLADRASNGPLLHRETQSGVWQRPRYEHVVVDEAQDLGSAHWRILRAVVPPGSNDLFLVGDPHQRIYGNYVSLNKLGINVRGRRSSKLTLSYRTTHEILARSLGLLGEESWDNMDDGNDNLAGYRSVLHGPAPSFIACQSWEDEQDVVAQSVSDLIDGPSPSIGVCVPDRFKAADIENRLSAAGIPAAALGPDGPKLDNVVHIGTMHRFKGLEYRHMIIAHVGAGSVPPRSIESHATTDPARYRRELRQARSLLFVAATRARDSLTITWHGTPSPFLP